MKKKLSLFLLICGISAGSVMGATIKIYVNDTPVKTAVAPIVRKGTTLVPLKAISEQMGAIVKFDKSTQSVIVYKEDRVVVLTIGSKIMYTYDNISGKEEKVVLNQAPVSVNGITMVPIRAMTKGLGCQLTNAAGEIRIKASVAQTVLLTDKELALKKELESRFPNCTTEMGSFDLTYSVFEGNKKEEAYDYAIYVTFKDREAFWNLFNPEMDEGKVKAAKTQLKIEMQEIADYLMASHQGKKFLGCYDHSYYVDETKEDSYIFACECSWNNYGENMNASYSEAQEGEFEWLPAFDMEQW